MVRVPGPGGGWLGTEDDADEPSPAAGTVTVVPPPISQMSGSILNVPLPHVWAGQTDYVRQHDHAARLAASWPPVQAVRPGHAPTGAPVGPGVRPSATSPSGAPVRLVVAWSGYWHMSPSDRYAPDARFTRTSGAYVPIQTFWPGTGHGPAGGLPVGTLATGQPSLPGQESARHGVAVLLATPGPHRRRHGTGRFY